MTRTRTAVAAAIAGAMLTVGIVGAVAYGARTIAVRAADPTPSPSGSPGTFTPKEDAAHEAGETAEQEAAENSGQRPGGGGHSKPNDNAAHEASETPEQEAAEHSGQRPASPARTNKS